MAYRGLKAPKSGGSDGGDGGGSDDGTCS